ncbi:LysR family transcriptional regulator [Jannaschia aquimarina]|uniref:AllS protein n=1 Tax=Jannaschia aquimarina TaxID=935700 RepID=A0A0D1CQU8_9RHOB|nr:LysR family transcriptional regulator [Jannaschia aquimarina]KIT17152.1 HTH-type transcriptional activator AllS [Jannaschia aquimarina]SNT17424.1 transcriptional regulator, LysR family [Jannaschia aquimarina]
MLDGVTVDQLRVLIAIADQGSFTKAAAHVQRAQSAVSHAIAQLEFQLDLQLFDRSTRRPTLTDAGRAVLAEARAVIDRMDALKARARSLGGEVEPRLTVAVSLLVPPDALGDVMAGFAERFPITDIGLLVQEAGGPLDLVREGAADLGLVGAFNLRGSLEGIVHDLVCRVPIRAVAAPDHPLARQGGPIPATDLREHRQLVAASARGAGTADPLSLAVWPIADQSVRRALLLRGFGWGIVPGHLVEADLAEGRLAALELETLGGPTPEEALHAIHARAAPPGVAGGWLLRALAARLDGHALPDHGDGSTT